LDSVIIDTQNCDARLCLQLRNSEGSLIIPKGSIEVNTSSTSVVIYMFYN